MSKKDNRFEIVERGKLGLSAGIFVFRDKQTGVHYLYCGSGYGGGLTPLLDSEGKPVTDKLY